MILNLVILLSVLATSILSGILGMAGGMILMAILVSTVSVAAAMMIHGVVQATANGSRAWFLRRHIQWRILPAYLLGSSTVLGLFSAVTLVPNSAICLRGCGHRGAASRRRFRAAVGRFLSEHTAESLSDHREQGDHPDDRTPDQTHLLRAYHRRERVDTALVLRHCDVDCGSWNPDWHPLTGEIE